MKFQKAARVLVLVLVLLVHADHRGVQGKAARLERWVNAGLQYLKVHLCRKVSLPESECRRLAHLHPSGIAVYTSEPVSGKVLAILPDSHPALKASQSAAPSAAERGFQDVSAHDAVLVLDPSPGESFGHPVLLFYLDFNVSKKKCAHMEGIYLGEECMTPALKTQCQNQLKRRRSRSDRTMDRTLIRRSAVSRASHTERSNGFCEIHFLPRVVGMRDSNRTQRLHCVDRLEFARCPQPLPLTSPSMPISSCELNKNTRRCHQQPLTTHLSCRLYQTCDHAVLLSGGWQEQIIYQHHEQNLLLFYQMLRNNGFHKDHIKTFFAGNGQVAAKETEGMYPATEKEVIRNHISYICRKQHCADTFVLYLNSPTRNDGTMLLWDRNNNGIADLKERYAVSELLADLAGCRASRVLLFVEQSYTGVLTKRLKGSLKHLNVVLLNGLPWVNTAQFWASLHPSHCLIDHLSENAVMPHVGDGISLLNVTLSGAPCNSTPPLSEAEMKREYMGCQNLPTALWHKGRQKS
ncbi:uncharacterized protein Hap1MRO34_006439 [Clarias gariepinus]|uniref:uncharacterized protein si:ch211-67e16.11 n=1 Tax=Clarias gariepinus TaxID=13013 RepID=UPI00234DF036|nr:uncharacterized protein si:ch211-67e16.11 [Clarias gariepinus]